MQRTSFSRRLIPGLLLALGSFGTAEASSVYLVSQTPTVTAGDQAIFELWMDFTGEPTFGGGVDIAYGGFTDGNQLDFVSWTPYLGNPDYAGAPFFAPGDPLLTSAPIPDPNGWSGTTMASAPTPEASGLKNIALGDFAGFDGSFLIGTLVFTANAAGGPYALTPGESAEAGGFYSVTGPQQFPTYTGDSVTVDPAPPAAVPLPGAAWLLLSGLGGIAAVGRRRKPG